MKTFIYGNIGNNGVKSYVSNEFKLFLDSFNFKRKDWLVLVYDICFLLIASIVLFMYGKFLYDSVTLFYTGFDIVSAFKGYGVGEIREFLEGFIFNFFFYSFLTFTSIILTLSYFKFKIFKSILGVQKQFKHAFFKYVLMNFSFFIFIFIILFYLFKKLLDIQVIVETIYGINSPYTSYFLYFIFIFILLVVHFSNLFSIIQFKEKKMLKIFQLTIYEFVNIKKNGICFLFFVLFLFLSFVTAYSLGLLPALLLTYYVYFWYRRYLTLK